jgi:hypothetical protein
MEVQYQDGSLIKSEVLKWIYLAEDRDQWTAALNTIINL